MAKHRRYGAAPGGFLRGIFYKILILITVAALVAAWFAFEIEKPGLELESKPALLGGHVEVPLRASDQKSGLSLVSVRLKQGETDKTFFLKTFPRQSWFNNAGPRAFSARVPLDVGEAGFREGPAELVIEARDQSLMGFFRGNSQTITLPVTVDTTPPLVRMKTSKIYLQPGGSAALIYTVSEQPVRHGVMLDDHFFPGQPTKKPDTYIAYFALPWDAKAVGSASVCAWDTAGNRAQTNFIATFRPLKKKQDTITLSDAFLQWKLPEFKQHYPEMQGDLLTQYLYVNGEVRRQNEARVAELCAVTASEQLWQGHFMRMPGAIRATFADQRTYLYQGRVVDAQTHLGVDIASVAQADVRAANRGKVVLAENLGIFGNVVMLDHGQGLFSLYAHLTSIDTQVGAMLEQNQLLGHSGMTGMAGGDHLHYAMLVHGVFVTPVEWWDQRWIDINIRPLLNE